MRRILIIDDEADIREVAALCMELFAQWEVIKACDACEGMERALQEQPDAILLDMKMPHTDGRATLAMLKGNTVTAHIPVLLLTAQALTSERRQLEALPVVAVLTKPFDPQTLAEEIASALGWNRQKPVQHCAIPANSLLIAN
ncbi:MAG TPA: response regulator [Acidisarcina sp.]|nr:response regulator [Acidisarcina sp.]